MGRTFKNFALLASTLLLFFTQLSCDTTEPQNNISLILNMEDVSCTEVWVQLNTTNFSLPANLTIMLNDQTKETINLTTADTLIYVDSLLPKQNYSLQVSSNQNQAFQIGQTSILSNKLSVTTLDTTSHNFTWQTFTFGEHSTSILYDVAIINESDIWAVGEIYMNDSLGNPDPLSYNAVHWNGVKWELKQVGNYGGWPCKSVFAFSENDIWFEGTIHWDGVKYTLQDNGFPLEPNGDGWQINKMWGSNSSDLYVVGYYGHIAHYNGSSWAKIESGTSTNILDVWGFSDKNNNENTIYCAVSYVFQNGDRKILRIENNKVDSLSWFSDKRVSSVWTSDNKVFYTAGDGVFEKKNNYWEQVSEIPHYYSDNIRGTGLNDIFVCGDFGLLSHFNGTTWHTYNEFYMQGILFSIAIRNNTVTAVGLNGNKAIIIQGKRN